MNKPIYPAIFAAIPSLAYAVVFIWQIPWWSGFRAAAFFTAAMSLVLLIYWQPLTRWHDRHPKLTKTLNITSAVMLLIVLLETIIPALIRDTKPHSAPQGIEAGPDIYFIVLDSYTGSQALLERFSVDNSAFLDELRNLGFSVGDCQSYFTYTSPTLSSLWNGTADVPMETRKNWRLVQRSLLRTRLEAQGYDWIAFATGYDWDELHDVAYYLEPELSGPTELELFLMSNPSWGDKLGERARARTDFILDHLDYAADLPGSQFTFAHIIQPHPPFVFNADGSPLDNASLTDPSWTGHNERTTVQYMPEAYIFGYASQVQYISSAIIPPLQEIVAKDPEAIIILIGDHGPWYAKTHEEARNILCSVRGDLPLDPIESFKVLLDGSIDLH